MDSSTITLGTCTFQIEGVFGELLSLPYLTEIPVFNANSVALIRCSILQRLIWFYTICQCPFNGTPGIKGLNFTTLWANSADDKMIFFLSFLENSVFLSQSDYLIQIVDMNSHT